jgi:hypothetical protein
MLEPAPIILLFPALMRAAHRIVGPSRIVGGRVYTIAGECMQRAAHRIVGPSRIVGGGRVCILR